METLLYKPLFINPQAYYVFPNINGRLEPKTDSGKEPAIFVGNIEVKTIAHGDIGKKQYFYNTNEIDLSAFSNSLVRISLYTNRGNVVLGEWDLDIIEEESENYIDPEILDSLCGVWIADQNTNESESRNIIKNKIADRGGDLELLNFGYKLNSGYNGYATDFTEWHGTYSNKTQTKITVSIDIYFPISIIYFKNVTSAPSFRIKVSGLPKGQNLYYKYINEEGLLEEIFNIPSDGIYTLPATAVSDTPTKVATLANEQYNINIKGLTIEQLPLYEGALVTDGKDDMIVSQKTVQEMLGGSNEVTVVSMVHSMQDKSFAYTNYLRPGGYIRNQVIPASNGKTGIYGYSISNISVPNFNNLKIINRILGDRTDYTAELGGQFPDWNIPFSVEGYLDRNSLNPAEVSSIAWYWTFIANKVLTTDQINQVISYFNLDKHVKPDVYYDVKKQGLSNDTPEADWYLKDFSGNGHDMTLYNFAKKLGSGIGKYEVDFNTWIPQSYVADSTYTSNKLHITNIKGSNAILYTKKGANAMKVKITGIQSFNLVYRYIAENDVWEALEVDRDGIYELPASTTTTKTYYTGFTVPYYTGDCDITIEQIPDYEGALVSDGIDDYGKVENLPIYKDYTVVADREIVDGLIDNAGGGVATRSYNYAKGAFGFDWKNQAFSFGGNTDRIIDVQRFISYQSKYINNGIQLITGNVVDNNPLYMARLGEENRYSKLALWSFLLFPYSLSEFLLERQLKRYKLGTLYPDMVEFRPVISGNIPYNAIEISQGSTTLYNKSINKTGIYLQEGSTVRVYIQPSGIDEVSKITVNGVEYTDLPINPNGFYYADFPIAKSPQKISYAIDEYIRYEDIDFTNCYPGVPRIYVNNKSVTWGDKLKVGDEFTFFGNVNILPEMYNVLVKTLYNGEEMVYGSIGTISKSMVFTSFKTYIFDDNEPKCILSPRLLSIPNSSYKILDYIPDISGHGNNGVINNSAYSKMSGANGYKYDWSTWRISKGGITSTITDSRLHITCLKEQYNPNQALFEPNTPANTGDKSNFKVNITGLTSDMKCTFNNAGAIIKELVNGVNEISVDLVTGWYGFMITALDGSVIGDCDITIQQIGQYEGSFCLDGVDDFVTIPTLAHGGKQVLMKVNYKLNNGTTCTIYDQRDSTRWLPTFCIYSNNEVIAYSDGNSGKTYIDGVLNTSVKGRQLANITHNITIANEDVTDVNSVSPKIGTLFVNGSAYGQMALFDFMLFPEISSEDEIKELNNIIGIEGNTDDLLTKINI